MPKSQITFSNLTSISTGQTDRFAAAASDNSVTFYVVVAVVRMAILLWFAALLAISPLTKDTVCQSQLVFYLV